MAEEAWIVMSRAGSAYIEAWRGTASNWFVALESVPVSQRSDDMFAVPINAIRFVRFVDGDPLLPEAKLVKSMPDGTLRRVAVDESVEPPSEI